MIKSLKLGIFIVNKAKFLVQCLILVSNSHLKGCENLFSCSVKLPLMWHKNHHGFFFIKFFAIPSVTSRVQSHREKQSKQMFDGHFEKHNAHLRRHYIFSKSCIPYTPIMLM